MTLSRSLPLALLLSGLCAVPAMARDRHDRHHRHDHGRHHHRHHRPSVSFGFYSGGAYPYSPAPFYPYYHSPAVVYAPRPVYVERPRQSVEYDVQGELARKGYYGGEIDGVIGSRTRAAIRTYQVDRGLPVTGRIDGALLRSLKLI